MQTSLIVTNVLGNIVNLTIDQALIWNTCLLMRHHIVDLRSTFISNAEGDCGFTFLIMTS